MFGKGKADNKEVLAGNNPQSTGTGATFAAGSDVSQLAPAIRSLADEARNGGAPEAAVNGLVAAGDQLDKQSGGQCQTKCTAR